MHTYTVKYHHRKPSKPLPPKTSIYKWKFTSRYLCTYIVTFCMHVCYSIYYTKLFSCFCYWRYFFNFSFSFYFMKIEAYISWTQTQVKSLIKSYTQAIVDWIYLCMKWMCVCDVMVTTIMMSTIVWNCLKEKSVYASKDACWHAELNWRKKCTCDEDGATDIRRHYTHSYRRRSLCCLHFIRSLTLLQLIYNFTTTTYYY